MPITAAGATAVIKTGSGLFNAAKNFFGGGTPHPDTARRRACTGPGTGNNPECRYWFVGLANKRKQQGDLSVAKYNYLLDSLAQEANARRTPWNLSKYWDALDLMDTRGSPVLSIDQARQRFNIPGLSDIAGATPGDSSGINTDRGDGFVGGPSTLLSGVGGGMGIILIIVSIFLITRIK